MYNHQAAFWNNSQGNLCCDVSNRRTRRAWKRLHSIGLTNGAYRSSPLFNEQRRHAAARIKYYSDQQQARIILSDTEPTYIEASR